MALGPRYRSRSYHMAIDLERSASTASSAGVTTSGLDTKASKCRTRLERQGVTSDATAGKSHKPTAVFALRNCTCVVELRAEGVIFAD